LKVRIFALAKELGLDSKKLIDLASEAGVIVKNSALASISPEERDLIVAHIDSRGAVEQDETQPVPVRESAVEESMKVRSLPPMSARAQGRPAGSEPVVEEQPVEEEVIPEQPEVIAAEEPAEPVSTEEEVPEVAAAVEETVQEGTVEP